MKNLDTINFERTYYLWL